MTRLSDLQAAAHTGPKRTKVRYTEPMWELLAQAMVAELLADSRNLGLNIIHLANQAQKNQTKVLLGEDYGNPSVSWPTRHFTAIVQLLTVQRLMHKQFLDMQEHADVLQVASEENKAHLKRIKELEELTVLLKGKKADLSDFPEEEIVAEAAFIQAQKATKIEKAAEQISGALSELKTLIQQTKTDTSRNIVEQADELQKTFRTAFDGLTKAVVPVPQAAPKAVQRHHHKR